MDMGNKTVIFTNISRLGTLYYEGSMFVFGGYSYNREYVDHTIQTPIFGPIEEGFALETIGYSL